MIDRLKLDIHFDPEKLKEDLRTLERTEWIDHLVKQNYEGNWSVIPLRSCAGAKNRVTMIYSDPNCKEFEDTVFLNQCQYFREVLDFFKCSLETVRLMKLTPGSIIKEHKDFDLDFELGKVRLHIPITTNPGVEFFLNNKRIIMHEGECWYLRLSDPHRVANYGKTDRVHIVIDAEVNDWIKEIFKIKI